MTRSACAWFIVSALLAIMACNSAADVTTAPERHLAKDAPIRTDDNPVIQSATGHYEVIGSQNNLNKISLSVLVHLNGSVDGELQYEQFTPENDKSILAHGDVICATIDGNTARVGVSGRSTTDAGTQDVFGYLTVIDNGEGANDPPDQASNIFGTLNQQRVLDHCSGTVPATFRIFTIERGNIQVRSAI